ncbi:MAG: hypothetical protein ACFBWO_18235 [Paracoccaceae bacterium]
MLGKAAVDLSQRLFDALRRLATDRHAADEALEGQAARNDAAERTVAALEAEIERPNREIDDPKLDRDALRALVRAERDQR